MRRCCFVVTILVIAASATNARAQRAAAAGHESQSASDGIPSNRFGAWISGTWNAPVSNAAGLPNTRALLIVGMERRYRLRAGAYGMLSFVPALLPAVYTTNNRRGTVVGCGGVTLVRCGGSGAAYKSFGIGVLPIALRYDSPFFRRFAMDAALDGGGIEFTRPVPVPTSTTFSFIARVGMDVKFAATSRTAVVIGYRHAHLSNGGLGRDNPGIDTPTLVAGWEWR